MTRYSQNQAMRRDPLANANERLAKLARSVVEETQQILDDPEATPEILTSAFLLQREASAIARGEKSANHSEQTNAPSKPHPEPNQREERVYPDGTVTDALGNFVGIDQPAATGELRPRK